MRGRSQSSSPSTSWSSCSSTSRPKSAWILYYMVVYAIYHPVVHIYHMHLLQYKCGASEQFCLSEKGGPRKGLGSRTLLCLGCSSCLLLFTCLSLLHPLRLNLGVLLLCQDPFLNPCLYRSLSMLPCMHISLDVLYPRAPPVEIHVSFYMTVSTLHPPRHFELWDLPYSALC